MSECPSFLTLTNIPLHVHTINFVYSLNIFIFLKDKKNSIFISKFSGNLLTSWHPFGAFSILAKGWHMQEGREGQADCGGSWAGSARDHPSALSHV